MKNIHVIPTLKPNNLFFKSLPISNKFPERFILLENISFNNLLLFRNKPIRYVFKNTLSNNVVGIWKISYKI